VPTVTEVPWFGSSDGKRRIRYDVVSDGGGCPSCIASGGFGVLSLLKIVIVGDGIIGNVL